MTVISNAVLASVVLGQCLGQSLPTIGWVKGAGVCASGRSLTDTFPTTYLCDCGMSNESCSTSYIESTVLGVGLCTTKMYDSGTCTSMNATIPSTKLKKSGQKGNNGNAYSTISQGLGVGVATDGAFISTASYLVTGGTFTYNKNRFYKQIVAMTETISEICIVPSSTTTSSAHTECGPERIANAGTFKFSLFAQSLGDDYEASATGKNYFTFRTLSCYKGMSDLKINTVADGTGIVGTETQVASISGKQTDGTVLTTTFPDDYMFGSTSGCTSGDPVGSTPMDTCVPTGSKKVTITAATAVCANSVPGFYIDYAFEMVDISVKDKWVAYDPDVTSSATPAGGSGTISEAGSQAKSSFFLLAALFAIASRS